MTKKCAISSINVTKDIYRKKFKSIESFIAECIMTDLMDRHTIKNIFKEIHDERPECYKDIKKTWEYIIKILLKEYHKEI